MDEAVIKSAAPKGIGGTRPEAIETFPFTEDRKRETAIVKANNRQLLVVTKGAAEVILALSTLDIAERSRWLERIARPKEPACATIRAAGLP